MRPLTIITAVVLSTGLAHQAECQSQSTPYKYPIIPGTASWDSLHGFSEMRAACQVPESILRDLTTEALIQTCLDYPLFLSFTAYDDSLGGMARVISGFNGMQELLTRKDAGSIIIKLYTQLDPRNCDPTWPPLQQGDYTLRLRGLELLIGHNSILSNLSKDQRRQLLALSIDRARAKLDTRTFGFADVESSALLSARLMLKDRFDEFQTALESNKRLGEFVARGRFTRRDDVDEILHHADNCLKTEP